MRVAIVLALLLGAGTGCGGSGRSGGASGGARGFGPDAADATRFAEKVVQKERRRGESVGTLGCQGDGPVFRCTAQFVPCRPIKFELRAGPGGRFSAGRVRPDPAPSLHTSGQPCR